MPELISYFAEWSVYDRAYSIGKFPFSQSSMAYAFFDAGADGKLVILDKWAALQKPFSDSSDISPDSWSVGDENSRGNFGQLRKLQAVGKLSNIAMSIGGWSCSKNFSTIMKSDSLIQTFTDEILTYLKTYPWFTTVDFDWEYVSNSGKSFGLEGNSTAVGDGDRFVKFLASLRSKLPAGKRITICVSADPTKLADWDITSASKYCDLITIMSYDHWSPNFGDTVTTHQANLYPATHTRFSADAAVKYLLSVGVAAKKLVIGVAAYSRGCSNTDGLGKSCSGNSPDSSWEPGICDVKTLPRAGATEFFDEECQAAYSYDPVKRVFNSYDNYRSAAAKAQYVVDHGLGGCVLWEVSSDYPANDPRSLVGAISKVFKANVASTVSPTPTPSPPTTTPTTSTQPLTTPPTTSPTTTTSTQTPSQLCCSPTCNCCSKCPCHTKTTTTPTNTSTNTTTNTTTQPPTTTTSTSTTGDWKAGTAYTVGMRVNYQGKLYQCINNHISQGDWTPSAVASLWKAV